MPYTRMFGDDSAPIYGQPMLNISDHSPLTCEVRCVLPCQCTPKTTDVISGCASPLFNSCATLEPLDGGTDVHCLNYESVYGSGTVREIQGWVKIFRVDTS